MKYMVNEKEARQLKKRGYSVVAGQAVDAGEMPEWIRKRAERLAADIAKPTTPKAETESDPKPWKASELRSLARALGRDRAPFVRELLDM